ncbi:hypothetical protein [Nonlabens xiamenensis]|uniref:hypothetical protein n=1 Tax=Nonlabens xiamenensis TaxID=2341043 RepID=UPI000F60E75B|nr:hypothetical protein [Nonlabens xiamenensis]
MIRSNFIKIIGVVILLQFLSGWKASAQSDQNNAQEKTEREEKIDATDFPLIALPVVQQIGRARKKVDYYKETDGVNLSYEAKLKYRRKRYSIEFDQKGVLEDVEIEIKNSEVPRVLRQQISNRLDTIARRFRIEKVQQQYRSNERSLTDLIKLMDDNKPDAYELIVAFKDQRKIYRKEMLFDPKGRLIQQRDIKRLEYDFLLF